MRSEAAGKSGAPWQGASPPLLPEVGVLALVPEEWSMLWQLRHHVLTRLAQYFHIVWVNPARELRGRRRGTEPVLPDGPFAQPPGLTLYNPPFWLPRLHRPPWLTTFAERTRLQQARSVLLRRGCRTIVLYIWRPEFARAMSLVPYDQCCYHIDDEYSFSDVERPTSEAETRLIAAVDQVFITSTTLAKKKGMINPHTTVIPNGADYGAYAARLPEPDDLKGVPRPRIGYTGVIKSQLDWPLILRLTERCPGWSFVFVGPVRRDSVTQMAAKALSARQNVHLLGFKPPGELAAYPHYFDVCIMPYRMNDYTKYVYPMKLHEYLASGRPTVGAPIASLEEFAEVVILANGYGEWMRALAEALEPSASAPERCAARQVVARNHDWNLLVRRIARTIAERLGPSCVERFERAQACLAAASGHDDPPFPGIETRRCGV